MSRLIRYVKCWLRFRIYYYFKIFRPSNFKIKGRLYFDLFSFIDFQKDSELTIGENVSLRKTRLYLHDSDCVLGSQIKMMDAVVFIKNSKVDIGGNSKFNKIDFSLYDHSSFKSGKHTLLDGSKNGVSGFYAEKATVEWGDNVNHYAYSKCIQSTWRSGSNIFINWGTQIRCESALTMGDNILISYDCIIFDTNTHSTDHMDRRKEIQQGYPNSSIQFEEDKKKIVKKPIIIGNDVWIGMRTIILKGTELGNQVIVGSGSVVSGLKVNEASKIAGNPARNL